MEVSGRRETPRKEDDKILCQPCLGEGDNLSAEGYCENCNEYFCKSCLKFHRKMAFTKNHVIKSKTEMPKVIVKRDPCVEPCDIHKTEIVKYYCHEHDSVGCGDCMVVDHKACKIDLICDVSGNYGNSEEFNVLTQNLEEVKKWVDSLSQEIKGNLKNAADMKNKIKEKIKGFRKEVNIYLDQAEAGLLNEVEKLNAKDVAEQTDQLKDCDSIETEIKQFQNTIHHYEDNINQLFVTGKLAKKKLKTIQGSLKSISSLEIISSYKFDLSKEIQALKISKSPLGTLSVETKTNTIQNKNALLRYGMLAKFIGEIDALAEREIECCITGMAMISKSEILLADNKNKSLKMLNVREGKITSKYKLQTSPWDVTAIDACEGAATLPEAGKIVFVNTRGGISESRCLNVKEWCRGIDCRNGKIAVSYSSYPAAVEILSMKGEVLHHTDFPVDNLYFPGYLCYNSDGTSTVMSDKNLNPVTEYIVGGQVKVKISESVNGPQGLSFAKDGTLVVCNQGGNDKMVMVVPNTRKVQPLSVEYVKEPLAVLIFEETSKMYISEDNSRKIKVFDIN